MNKKSIINNIIWSVISLLISTGITMTILPYVSKKIGIEAYGYIALCNNIVSYIDLGAATINVYAVRFISIEYHKNNLEKANCYYSSVMIANVIIAVILIVPAMLCICFIEDIFNVPVNLITDIRLLFAFSLLHYAITLLGAVFSTAAFVKDILYKDTKIKAEGNIIKALIIIVLFVFTYPHVWYVTVATIACSIYVIVSNIRLSYRNAPELKIKANYFKVSAIKEIASNGIWNTIASLGITLNSGLDLLVTNFYLGAIKMGQLSVPKTLSNFITVLLNAITNSFRPQLLVFYTRHEKVKLKAGFQLSMKICGMVTGSFFCVFVAIGRQFLNLWLPDQDINLIYNLAVLTFLAEVLTGFVKPLHYGCVLTGKLKWPCIMNLLVGVFNLGAMLIFLNTTKGGLYVVTLTTVFGNIAYNFIIMPWYVSKILDVSKVIFYKMILFYMIVIFLITIALWGWLRTISISDWRKFAVYCIMSIGLGVGLYSAFMFNAREKENLKNIFMNKLKMKK